MKFLLVMNISVFAHCLLEMLSKLYCIVVMHNSFILCDKLPCFEN